MLKSIRLSYKEKKNRSKKKAAAGIAMAKAGAINANKPSHKAKRKLKRRMKNMRRKVNNSNLIEEWQKELDKERAIKKEANDIQAESCEAGRTSKDAEQS